MWVVMRQIERPQQGVSYFSDRDNDLGMTRQVYETFNTLRFSVGLLNKAFCWPSFPETGSDCEVGMALFTHLVERKRALRLE